MTVNEWLACAVEDAERRGLGELKPLLESLARSTASLRRAAGKRLPAAGRVEDRGRD